MVDTQALLSIITLRGKTQKDVAERLNMAPGTFYRKIKIGKFDSDEMDEMIDYLNIEEPTPIFFAKKVT